MSGGEEEEEFKSGLEDQARSHLYYMAREEDLDRKFDFIATRRLQLHLHFFEGDYELTELIESIEGIEHLLILAAASDGHPAYRLPVQVGYYPGWLEDMRDRFRSRATVDRISLNSPLDMIITVAGASAFILPVLRGWIKLRNEHSESRRLKAQADAHINHSRLQSTAALYLLEQFKDLEPAEFDQLPKNHPLKQLVNKSAKSLTNLDSVDVKRRGDPEREK